MRSWSAYVTYRAATMAAAATTAAAPAAVNTKAEAVAAAEVEAAAAVRGIFRAVSAKSGAESVAGSSSGPRTESAESAVGPAVVPGVGSAAMPAAGVMADIDPAILLREEVRAALAAEGCRGAAPTSTSAGAASGPLMVAMEWPIVLILAERSSAAAT